MRRALRLVGLGLVRLGLVRLAGPVHLVPLFLLVVGALLPAAPSHAHGFGAHGVCLVSDTPTAYALAFPRAAPGEVVAMTNFGVLRSEDGGATFGWGCVEGYSLPPTNGFLDGAPKTLTVLDDGTQYVLYTVGYRESRDGGCGYRFAPDPSLMSASVVWVTSSPIDADVAYAVASAPGEPPFGIFKSVDGGRDYAPTGMLLYDFGVPVTSLVSSADGLTLYALSLSFESTPILWRSRDAGASFTALPISLPSAPSVDDAMLLGVDPADPDALYLEVSGEPSGTCSFRTRVLYSDDGGASFDELSVRSGDVLTGAVVRDDGALWVAWKDAGLERLSPDGTRTTLAALPLSCIAQDDEGIVVCPFGGEPALALRYDDDTGALTPLLTRAQVTGALRCEPGTRGADVCTPRWPEVSAALGLGAASPDAGPDDAGPDDAGLPTVVDAGDARSDAGAGEDIVDAGDPIETPVLDLESERRERRASGCASSAPPSLLALVLVLGLVIRRRG